MAEKPRLGRRRDWPELDRARLLHEMAKDPPSLGYAATSWTVSLLATHLGRQGWPVTARTLRRRLFPGSVEVKEETDAPVTFNRDRVWAEYFFDQGAGNRITGVEGTLWAAYNGVTEWLDHRKTRQSTTQRLTSIWFGGANRLKVRALTTAVDMLPHWRN